MPTDRVTIFDTTLRDGEQAPGFSLRTSEKVELARQLDALGVDLIEAGFPIASLDDAEGVRQVAAAVRRPDHRRARALPAGRHRARRRMRCKGAERSRIHTFIATSDLHLEKKLNISREQCLASAVAAVKQARGYTDDVQFSAEDATRSDMGFLSAIVEAVIKAGATTINLPDTVGYATPDEIHDFFVTIQVEGAELGQSRVQRALPRRPRPCRGEHARGGHGRRASGRVHHQRHRRARGQRVARRDRHGDAS